MVTQVSSPPPTLTPAHSPLSSYWPIALGLALLYIPTFWDLMQGIWGSDQQGHGPLVLGLSMWLIWRQREALLVMPVRSHPWVGWPLIAVANLMYALGRSQGILIFEVGSALLMISGLIILLLGVRQWQAMWFALFFMCFMVPLPSVVVDALTQPMKLAVSYVAEHALYSVGYPISRTGVIIAIGPFQLLVADACAGLHTLFTLEALGLLYLNVVRVSSVFRNVALAILIVPISFGANVIRVIVLSLITYHFGDAAGQGFLHGFAGMVLFLTALLLIVAADTLLRTGDRLANRGRR